MLTADFDYELPPEQIAQDPVEPRDCSRLLVLHRDSGAMEHRVFRDIVEYLRPGDLLIANETRVIPARLHAHKIPSGGRVELLLLSKLDATCWEALVKGRRVAVGQRLVLVGDETQGIEGVVEAITASGGRRIRFAQPIDDSLDNIGDVPLPPYIHKPLDDPERYQTVYAQTRGSVAAPTAGLHFTPELLERTRAMGVEWAFVLLHIGLDTFRPVTEERVEEHAIHTENCQLTADVAERINRAKREGRRVIAVGTTSVRVLETAAQPDAGVGPWDGPTDLYIYPGYAFRVVDALITNFHLPRSSLLMLVSAFAARDAGRVADRDTGHDTGRVAVLNAYRTAVAEGYRFYSLGDSMLIL